MSVARHTTQLGVGLNSVRWLSIEDPAFARATQDQLPLLASAAQVGCVFCIRKCYS